MLGIPRGGVVVAAEVARALHAELDILVVRKIGAPGQPELAIGGVSASGQRVLNDELIGEIGVPAEFVDSESAREAKVARDRAERLRGDRPDPRIEGRTVILVDDGIATGATMRTASRVVRAAHPKKLVVAIPVGGDQSCADVATDADEVLCLKPLEPFFAIAQRYERFTQVSDEEVLRILAQPTVSAAA